MGSMKSMVRTRFAPSPSGFLHLGNARTALFNALLAKRGNGKFLLRIEDTDAERTHMRFVESLLDDLRWLNIEWDEGPADATSPSSYFQSRRGGVYARYYRALEERGLAYPCFCSPGELECARRARLASGRPPRYSGKCAHLTEVEVARRLAQGAQPSLRFRVPEEALIEFDDLVRGAQKFRGSDIGDFVIRRADGSAAFFFCNAVDDASMEVTHVLRGADHLPNTPRQILLLEALDLRKPEYGHISLITGDDGAPLSKRNGSRSLRELREAGYLPRAVVNLLARLGHSYAATGVLDMADLAREFTLEALGKAPARFDPKQLDHWQRAVIGAENDKTLWDWLPPAARELIPAAQRGLFLGLVRSNCSFPADAGAWARVLFTDPVARSSDITAIARQGGSGFFAHALEAARRWPHDFSGFIEALKQATGARGKRLFQPLRAALTGRLDGPDMATLYSLIDPARLRQRLGEFIETIPNRAENS